MHELATYDLDGPIATISMDDGKVNVFSIPMLRAVHAALDEAERDGAVVVLTGREGYFSAGFDLKTIAGGPEPLLEMLTLGATLAERLALVPETGGGDMHRPRIPSGSVLAPCLGRAHRSRRALSARAQRGANRPDGPLVRDRAGQASTPSLVFRPFRRHRHDVRSTRSRERRVPGSRGPRR